MMETTTIYDNVIHKKITGRLTLVTESISFGNLPPIGWGNVVKHQVSPASHPKCLLKLVVSEGKPGTYQFVSREELERIRRDITNRLQQFRSNNALTVNTTTEATTPTSNGGAHQNGQAGHNLSTPSSVSGQKRSHAAMLAKSSFGELDKTAVAVTRSSLLAANPTLRAQHQYLVQETQTLEEEDFWSTHQDLLEEEFARISGMTKAGTSSLLQSHLQLLTGRVTLGVEEMRQIFVLYPAVHKAYEEKVPLELSDEQFWRKYLESEYFHRDRGRIGAASRRDDKKANKPTGKNKMSLEDQEARAAAVGTDDLFSRYDQKIREESGKNEDGSRRKWGTKLAVGQFDLASTFETERGSVLEGPRDSHPPSASDDGKGAKVIQKYNRHWAMVLHPEDAVAGSDLMEVARKSVKQVLAGDQDAKAGGGVDSDMARLVGFANSSSEDANHALGIGLAEEDEYEELTLKNIEAYYAGQPAIEAPPEENEQTRKRTITMAATCAQAVRGMMEKNRENKDIVQSFPPVNLGVNLLKALTKKMMADSKTDADALEVVKSLPDEFKKRLHSYFRRSSELLRHFFGLRKLAENGNNAYNDKLKKIVVGMENLYNDVKKVRDGIDLKIENAQTVRAMYLQIMDQLDWAFKLNNEVSSAAGSGFVTIEEF